MKRVATTDNPLHAHMILALLEEHGIKACIQGEALWGARGELPISTESAPSVWVLRDEDVETAARLIAEREGAVNPTKCLQCGYDLRGLDRPRCPECGAPFRVTGDWVCPCGEQMGTQFSSCWKCGTSQEEAVRVIPAQHAADDAKERDPDPSCPKCSGTGRMRNRGLFWALMAGGLLSCWLFLSELFFPRHYYVRVRWEDRLGLLFTAVAFFLFAWRFRRRRCPCARPDQDS